METIYADARGTLLRHADWEAPALLPRHVDVWLPPGYATSGLRYPVIYMHDGQNLFDPALAFAGQPWSVDVALRHLMATGESQGAIIVGPWNSAQRWRDYMPARPLLRPEMAAVRAEFEEKAGGPMQSDAYVAFLAEQLKPAIDGQFRTRPEPEHTVVIGSSMGGLISLYALSERPDVFGRAGCVSTHWPAGEMALVDAMGAALPRPGHHRIYFDYGTEDVDAPYEPFQLRMDAHMRATGYRFGVDWLSRKFPGAGHNEVAWRARVAIPLAFLLG